MKRSYQADQVADVGLAVDTVELAVGTVAMP